MPDPERMMTPFSNGTEYEIWFARNCSQCGKFDFDRFFSGEKDCLECPIAAEIHEFGDVKWSTWLEMGGNKEGIWASDCKKFEPRKHETGGLYKEPQHRERCPETIEIKKIIRETLKRIEDGEE